MHWKDWYWSWSSNILATWCEELTLRKRPWCWERLKVGGEGDDRGWDGWMASPTWWTWLWASFRSWWWIGKPGMLHGVASVGCNWATELNWLLVKLLSISSTILYIYISVSVCIMCVCVCVCVLRISRKRRGQVTMLRWVMWQSERTAVEAMWPAHTICK